MQIRFGQHIATREGEDVGSVRTLVADPSTLTVKTVVASRGRWHDDLEIPLAELQADSDDEVRLIHGGVDELEPYRESSYVTASRSDTVPRRYATAGVLWPSMIGGPTQVTGYPYQSGMPVIVQENVGEEKVDENRAEVERDNAVLSLGDSVRNEVDQPIGTLTDLIIDARTGRIIRVVAQPPGLFKAAEEFAGDRVEAVDDHAVYVRVEERG